MNQIIYRLMYRFTRPAWDTGITPPEVVEAFAQGDLPPGPALDLGCGTGTNSIYLAQHGYRVSGVDFAHKAIELARTKAKRAGVVVDFYINDVTHLDFIREPFDLILDIGCFHGLDKAGRSRYVANVERLACPGGQFLLYAFGPRSWGWRNIGVTEEQIREAFSPGFVVRRVEHGTDRGQFQSAWYWLERKG